MTADPDHELKAALRRAIERDGSPELRLHLACLVLDGDPGEALGIVTEVLSSYPEHVEAMLLAATACDALNLPDRATAYRRVAAALQPNKVAMSASPNDLGDLAELWGDQPGPAEPDIGELTRPRVTLKDVAGMSDVKRFLDMSFFAPLRNPELAIAFNKRVRGGLLLWGPPGCGKTYLARAIAGELGASFYSIGIADVLDMWIGSSERNLQSIFRWARNNAPCVLFLDELDALGRKRSDLRQGGASLRGTVNQLLAELDGCSSNNDGVYVLGATNHPWDLDEALTRPGRFDRSLLVLPPEEAARDQILRQCLSDRPTGELNWKRLVAQTDGWSGADVTHLCEAATELAMTDSLAEGRVVRIGDQHFRQALRDCRPSVEAWLQIARNYVTYSNGDGRFDGLMHYLSKRR